MTLTILIHRWPANWSVNSYPPKDPKDRAKVKGKKIPDGKDEVMAHADESAWDGCCRRQDDTVGTCELVFPQHHYTWLWPWSRSSVIICFTRQNRMGMGEALRDGDDQGIGDWVSWAVKWGLLMRLILLIFPTIKSITHSDLTFIVIFLYTAHHPIWFLHHV